MKRAILVVLGGLIIWLGTASQAPAAELSYAECRSAVRGIAYGGTGDSEVRQAMSIELGFGFVTTSWHWAGANRVSAHRINQWIGLTNAQGVTFSHRAVCYDSNNSGQIGSSEDWVS